MYKEGRNWQRHYQVLKLDALKALNEPKAEHVSIWGIGDGSEHPLPDAAIQQVFDQKSGVKVAAAAWKRALGSRALPDPEFPRVVEYETPLKVCAVGSSPITKL